MISQQPNGSNFLSSGEMSRTISRTSSVFEDSYKIINDPIHGHIKLDQDTLDFVDTVQFQRLRDLKQVRAYLTHFSLTLQAKVLTWIYP
jgi:hypothetical protein